MLLETPGLVGRCEESWVGRVLDLGCARLRILGRAPRCTMTGLAQGSLRAMPRILGHLARRSEGRLGVYAEVLESGSVTRGAPARLMAD